MDLFLILLAFVWIIFAVIQDVRTTEISNWLTFSLIAFALAYRAFYSIHFGNLDFFVYGLGGVALFTAFGYGLYYSKAFAGGDAKLLIGLGGVLPFSSIYSYLYVGLGFIVLLFVCGGFYSIIYSAFLAAHSENFVRDFKRNFVKSRKIFLAAVTFSAFLFLAMYYYFSFLPLWYSLLFSLIFAIWPIMVFYAKAVESSCMIKLTKPQNLMEGDWLVSDVKVGNKIIKKTVHGLTRQDISFLRKKEKSVVIKNGIPFGPAFLLAFIALLWYLSR